MRVFLTVSFIFERRNNPELSTTILIYSHGDKHAPSKHSLPASFQQWRSHVLLWKYPGRFDYLVILDKMHIDLLLLEYSSWINSTSLKHTVFVRIHSESISKGSGYTVYLHCTLPYPGS